MLTCRETARLIARDELGATARERVGLRLHLLMCRLCRRYRTQLRALGKTCREELEAAEEDRETLARLERSILGQADAAARAPRR